MRFFLIPIICTFLFVSAYGAVTYNFTGQGAIFDNQTNVVVPLLDGGISFDMTLVAVGDDFNSNIGGLGIGDDSVDGTAESILIFFSTDVLFNFIEFGSVGADVSDGVSFTIGGVTTDLFTGVSNFAGVSDVFTPAAPIFLAAGDTIVLSGSSVTSSYDLESINISAIPEVSSTLLGLMSMLVFLRRVRS